MNMTLMQPVVLDEVSADGGPKLLNAYDPEAPIKAAGGYIHRTCPVGSQWDDKLQSCVGGEGMVWTLGDPVPVAGNAAAPAAPTRSSAPIVYVGSGGAGESPAVPASVPAISHGWIVAAVIIGAVLVLASSSGGNGGVRSTNNVKGSV